MGTNWILSPFTTIRNEGDHYTVGSLLTSDAKYVISTVGELAHKPWDYASVFTNELDRFRTDSFDRLEALFLKQADGVGYVETTSVCPYVCQICPKGAMVQVRRTWRLDLDIVRRVFYEMSANGFHGITLHLFGDPFYDPRIYDVIRMANYYGLVPSFSTNLISLARIDMGKLEGLKVGEITVSVDSTRIEHFSQVRGRISEGAMLTAFERIKELAQLAVRADSIGMIVLQLIVLAGLEGGVDGLAEEFGDVSRVRVKVKKYIRFPGVNSQYETDEIVNKGETVLLYRLLGVGLPFKCLKPWVKREAALMSDGSFVPCCLSINQGIDLGDCGAMSLQDIFKSDVYRLFRKGIFTRDPKLIGSVCRSCSAINQPAYLQGNSENLRSLRSMCVEKWG